MRWWQAWVFGAALMLCGALLVVRLEHRLAEAEAERDRLAEQLSRAVRTHDRADTLRDQVRRLKDYVGELECARLPRRGPYPDGMSDERLDPWRPGTRQASAFTFAVPGSGVCAVTADPPACAAGPLVRGLPSPPTPGDHNVKDVFVFTPPPLPGNETVAVGPLAPDNLLPPAPPKVRTYTGMLLERKDAGGDPAFVLVTRDADYWLGQDPRRTPLADLRALVGREVRVKSAGQATVGTRRFLTAVEVKPAGDVPHP
jgi:hypothetical protein